MDAGPTSVADLVESSDGLVVPVSVDPVVRALLVDHQVAGTPLLPTVLQLELLVDALLDQLPASAGLRLRGIEVAAPVRFTDGKPPELSVHARPTADGAGWDARLESDQGVLHLKAHLDAADAPELPEDVRPAAVTAAPLSGTPDQVYPPLFHGPAFQVVDGFGRTADGLVAELAEGDAARSWDPRPWVLPARLVELLLQSCGVWELSETGQMMRPSRIDEGLVSRSVPQTADGPWRAFVTPRPDPVQ